ncbi:MAG: TetR/AcrR family transcriptional regulator [Burkholderiales bacterium]|nr:MAG: TetR/AcrR family transcriptional regulator [Burkholderiales bacterium]
MPKVLSPQDIEAFRERLCDIAEEKFAAQGINGVTLRDLATTMGVSPMTPYRYFKDKDAILAAVRSRAFNRFAETMEKSEGAMRKKGGGQPGDTYIDWALTNPAAYRMIFDTNQPTSSSYPELIAAMKRAKETMTAGWKVLREQGRFKGDVELAGHLHWSAMHGAVMLELTGLLKRPHDARAIARRALTALLRDLDVKPKD